MINIYTPLAFLLFHLFNEAPSYLLSYIRFNCQLSRQDLRSYVSTRTQAIWQPIFDLMLNQLVKIFSCMFQWEPKLCSKLTILLKLSLNQLTLFNIKNYKVNRNWRNSIPAMLLISHDWDHNFKYLCIYRTVKV